MECGYYVHGKGVELEQVKRLSSYNLDSYTKNDGMFPERLVTGKYKVSDQSFCRELMIGGVTRVSCEISSLLNPNTQIPQLMITYWTFVNSSAKTSTSSIKSEFELYYREFLTKYGMYNGKWTSVSFDGAIVYVTVPFTEGTTMRSLLDTSSFVLVVNTMSPRTLHQDAQINPLMGKAVDRKSLVGKYLLSDEFLNSYWSTFRDNPQELLGSALYIVMHKGDISTQFNWNFDYKTYGVTRFWNGPGSAIDANVSSIFGTVMAFLHMYQEEVKQFLEKREVYDSRDESVLLMVSYGELYGFDIDNCEMEWISDEDSEEEEEDSDDYDEDDDYN